jgi:hypothetical protein
MALTSQSLPALNARHPARRLIRARALAVALAWLTLIPAGAAACDAPQASFCIDYFSGIKLSGPAVFTTTEPNIDHSWQNTSPDPSVPAYNLSGHWSGKFNFNAGDYIFSALSDDGVRILVDGQPVIDGWKSQAATQYTATIPLSAGEHLVEAFYYQAWGWARLAVNWEPVLACDAPVGQFCAAYFANRNLAGNPKLIAYEANIDHLWANGGPAANLPSDNFSSRWQGDFDFPPGTYSFMAKADDGVRVWVDGKVLIDAWVNQPATQYEEWLWLGGRHRIAVEYFEAYADAVLQVNWGLITPASTTTPTPIGANALSPLGVNLSDWSDWATEQPFINLFKTSRAWITQAPGVWDTGEEQSLNLDQNGWVRSLPAATDTSLRYRTVSTLLLSGHDFAGIRPGGEYVVLYEGEGTLTYGYAATRLASHSSPGRDVINVDKNDTTGILITITATDPNHTGNYLRNIRVVSPGVVCDDDALAFCYTGDDPACQRSACRTVEAAVPNRLFHPLFLRNLVYYRSLRFMTPQNTNVITSDMPQQVNWSDRATLDQNRWPGQAGIPVEVAVALSNQVQADPWLNIPHRASDDYIRQFARLTRATLAPSRKVYLEYANEIWNTAFSAGSWVEQQGLAAWPNSPDSAYTKRINWYGKRTAEVCDIWRSEWAGEEGRIVCVVSAQAANTWTANAALDCALWNRAPCQAHGIKAVAIAPYFGHYVGGISSGGEVAGWTADADGGLGRLFAELDGGGQLTGGPAGGALALQAQWVAQYANLARNRGLLLLAYEGGQHLVGVGSTQNNTSVTSLFVAANRDPRMGGLYQKMLEKWHDAGGGLFMHYANVGQYGRYGSWGALESMGQQTSPKLEALIRFIAGNPY